MSFIGFELIAKRAWTVLPGHTFSMSVLWNKKKIPSSIGRDIYHQTGLILPDKRIAATGRIHHLSEHTINHYEPLQTAPCKLICRPDFLLDDLKIELLAQKKGIMEPFHQTAVLFLWSEENNLLSKTELHLDPQSIERNPPDQYFIDLSFLLGKI
ncbi:hypothetical protein AADC60_15965 [Cytobacillus pseudoceanisediminis]|jgi:hypothetical protein|uniref:Uncharacterized protein n=1 Tax=Cytobacillus pseudoceanisediminis TaxID=3051614 RepID=A0ABZ2ZD04_9BACI|nr:hypothetical protein [Cytobacillus oceanisediminis]MCM3530198.1 hypothetical protein [Cytobacillus oceanisediminis]MCS0823883.1 hypothetical protein [Cytobacillus firmus]